MKKLIFAFAALLLLCACSKSNELWEYTVLKYGGKTLLYYNGDNDNFLPVNIDDPQQALNQLGQDGWELVSTYTTIETVFPNFGNSEYVTGIRGNTRTRTVNFVLKRKTQKKAEAPITNGNTASEVSEEVVEEVIIAED